MEEVTSPSPLFHSVGVQLNRAFEPLRLLYAPSFNPLNAELNPICHLLALLGAHHILHVSRIRVKHSKILQSVHRVNLSAIRTNSDFALNNI